MQIRYGFDIELELFQPTTIVTVMDVHPTRHSNVIEESGLHCNQDIRFEKFIDCFGNVSRRINADAGPLAIKLQGLLNDTGLHDPVVVNAAQTSVSMLPADVLPFLAASRYCETDLLSDFAWRRFGSIPGGWARVQAACDYVNNRLNFSYPDGIVRARHAGRCRHQRY
jgi:transglutaminase-like putative cysteine protease